MMQVGSTFGDGSWTYGGPPDRARVERAMTLLGDARPFYSVWDAAVAGEGDGDTASQFVLVQPDGDGYEVIYRTADGGMGRRSTLLRADGGDRFTAAEATDRVMAYLDGFAPPIGALLREHPADPPLPQRIGRTLNSRSTDPLLDYRRGYRDELLAQLRRMNGTTRWSVALWPIPPRVRTWNGIWRKWSSAESYLQCAGTADAMVIELREHYDDGTFDHFAVVRPEPAGSGDVVVRWTGEEMTVPAAEAFAAEEAAEVFLAYARTLRPPAEYGLRRLDELSSPAIN